MESQHRGGEGGGFLWTIFGVAFQRRTYASLFYLLIGAPVAVAFWVALVTLLAVGGGLSITVVGIPLLLATMFAWCVAADLERLLSNALLGTTIRPLPFGQERGMPWRWERLKARLRNSYTWRALFYLLVVRFPMGIAGLVVVSTTLGQAFHLFFAPFHVAIGLDNQIGPWTLDSWTDAAIATPLGILWLFPALHIVRLAGWVAGKLNTLILQSPETRSTPPAGDAVEGAATAAVAWPGVWSAGGARLKRQRSLQMRIWTVHFALYAGVMLLLLVINGLATPGTPWVLWPAWGWGIALALHTGYLIWGHLGGHIAAFLVTNIGFFVIDAALAENTWFQWPLIAWAITLAAHAYLYFAYAPVEAEPLLEYHEPSPSGAGAGFGPAQPRRDEL